MAGSTRVGTAWTITITDIDRRTGGMGSRGVARGDRSELLTAHGRSESVPYTIQRRPAPTSNAREVSLPTNVVIDMTTWGYPSLGEPDPRSVPGCR